MYFYENVRVIQRIKGGRYLRANGLCEHLCDMTNCIDVFIDYATFGVWHAKQVNMFKYLLQLLKTENIANSTVFKASNRMSNTVLTSNVCSFQILISRFLRTSFKIKMCLKFLLPKEEELLVSTK